MTAPTVNALAFVVASLSVVSSAAPQSPLPARLVAKIDSAARAAIAKKETPSVAIAISRKGHTVYAKAFGQADLEQGVRATPRTVYLIGSITKQFTAAAVLSLVEAHKLSLDDTLGKFYPAWPSAGRGVTVRQLLNHTSGIKDYTGVAAWPAKMALPLPHDSIIALFRDEPMDFAPGTEWRYDNSGYFLLGTIIEKASGMRYDEFVRTRLFEKAGLTSARYCDSRTIVPMRAVGYNAANGSFTNAAPIFVDQAYAAGAICSTASDLVQWTRALQSGKVISPDAYRQMTTPIPLPGGKAQQYGFGLGVSELAKHRMISHNGGINGFNSDMLNFPDDSLIVAVLVNVESGEADKLGMLVSRWALGIPDDVIKDLPVTDADVARIVGKYVQRETAIEVKMESGHLMALGLEAPTKLLHQGGGEFRLALHPDLRVTFSGAGAKAEAMVVAAPGGAFTLARVP